MRPTRNRARLDLRAGPGALTWDADRSGLVLRLAGPGGDVTLDLGLEAVAQLKQALAWAGDVFPAPVPPRTCSAALCA